MLKDIDLRREVEKVSTHMKVALDHVKEELDEHREGINRNTDEVQQNYEFLATMEAKIDKLTERLDAIEMLLSHKQTRPAKIELSHREQEVFLVLYSSTEKLTKKMISRRLGFTDEMVVGYLSNIIAKGVPVLRQIMDMEEHFFLDLKFRETQAKHKIITVNEEIVKELFN